ncbi:hypothetical protein MTR67_007313 [Solanum verrucosum]|uniref:Uncharacterized protein n=1 Tax=Solanum verrucosum TaxID=315347 RepID=A0AAF0TEY6_SOLVR|nr:hypothetical protein MTR67_007313 [Solanum verrucosum]
MALTQKSCFFLSCFGFSDHEKDKVKSVKIKRKNSSCFSFIKFHRKKWSSAKTVSINKNREEIHVFKSRQLPTSTTLYVLVTDNSKAKMMVEKCKKWEYSSCKKGLLRSFTSGEDKHDTSNVIWRSILMVTLITMLFWGKFCAILCTSSCLYFLPTMKSTYHGT